jgi:hypothetical protein
MTQDKTKQLFDQVLHLLDDSGASRDEAAAVLLKLLVLISIANDEDKQTLMTKVNYVFDWETFNNPTPKEIH